MALFVKVCVCSQVVRKNPQPFRASQPSLIKAPWSPTSSRCCPITGSTPALWPREPLRRLPASLYLPSQPLGENAQGCGGEVGSIPGRIPWRRTWRPASVFLPGKSRGQRGLAGSSPQGCKESDTTGHARRKDASPAGGLCCLSTFFPLGLLHAPLYLWREKHSRAAFIASPIWPLQSPRLWTKESWSSLYKWCMETLGGMKAQTAVYF